MIVDSNDNRDAMTLCKVTLLSIWYKRIVAIRCLQIPRTGRTDNQGIVTVAQYTYKISGNIYQ